MNKPSEVFKELQKLKKIPKTKKKGITLEYTSDGHIMVGTPKDLKPVLLQSAKYVKLKWSDRTEYERINKKIWFNGICDFVLYCDHLVAAGSHDLYEINRDKLLIQPLTYDVVKNMAIEYSMHEAFKDEYKKEFNKDIKPKFKKKKKNKSKHKKKHPTK